MRQRKLGRSWRPCRTGRPTYLVDHYGGRQWHNMLRGVWYPVEEAVRDADAGVFQALRDDTGEDLVRGEPA